MDSGSQERVVAGGPSAGWVWAGLPLMRLTGGVLVILALLDLLESLIPLRLRDPLWEMQFMGTFIERSPVPLLGLALVFLGEMQARRRWEGFMLAGLSWLSLILGLTFALMIPLILRDTFRLVDRGTAQINSQVRQQLAQAEKLESMVNAASPQELDGLLQRAGQARGTKSPEQVRAEMLAEFNKSKLALQQQAEESRGNQRVSLIKRSAKWIGQAAVVGGVLVYLWRSTQWARRSRRPLPA